MRTSIIVVGVFCIFSLFIGIYIGKTSDKRITALEKKFVDYMLISTMRDKFQGDAIKEILGSEYEGFKYQWASNGVIELRANYDRLNR